MDDMHAGGSNGGSNRKMLGGLVLVIGIGLLFAALSTGGGSALLSFLPFLLVLACPLMMIFMMGSIGHNQHHMSGLEGQHSVEADDLPDVRGLSRDQQVWALRHALTRMAWRQEALRQTLDKVEADQRAERIIDAESTATSPTSR